MFSETREEIETEMESIHWREACCKTLKMKAFPLPFFKEIRYNGEKENKEAPL